MRELTSWLSRAADPETFPYPAVLREFHRVGKHFVKPDLLALLDRARAGLPPAGAGTPGRLLGDFLDVALDKWDGRYDYRSYLALRLLGLPGEPPDGPGTGPGRREHDLLLVRLVADALAFEHAAEVGSDLLPQQRPTPEVVAKRYRLGLRVVSPALARLGRPGPDPGSDPAEAAVALHTGVEREDPAGARTLRLSMLPVYLSHDEYLFVRVLQAYECVFARVAAELHDTLGHLGGPAPVRAAGALAYAREVLAAAGPLFSLLATMQPESFRTFREYTEGASAIQSRSYKLMESLCRVPDPRRLDSAAYRQVPEVRDRVLLGHPVIDGAYRAAVDTGRLTGADRTLVETRMDEFATAVLQWRRTHYRLAVRMLGTRPGTGYTEGTPYLAGARGIPVFTALPHPPHPSADRSGGCPV